MSTRAITVALMVLLSAPFNFSQSGAPKQSSQPDAKPLVGVWRGQMDDLPAVTLTITDEGGGLSGAILFYLHRRTTVNDPYTSTPGIPEPLLNPTFDGKSLAFQVSHRHAHPPRTLHDPPVRFRLTLTGPDKGELVNEDEGSGPGLPIVREK